MSCQLLQQKVIFYIKKKKLVDHALFILLLTTDHLIKQLIQQTKVPGFLVFFLYSSLD